MWKSELLPLEGSGENLKQRSFGCFWQAKYLLKDYLSIKRETSHMHKPLSLSLLLNATLMLFEKSKLLVTT